MVWPSLTIGVSEMLLIETFCFILIATIQDLRKREVSDLVNYSFIITSLFLRIVWFIIERDINTIILVFPSVTVFFGFSYVMYRAGQWGGGDVKLAVGVSIALADSIFSLVSFFINLIIFGAAYGLIFTIAVGLKGWRKVVDNINVSWAVFSIVCVLFAIGLFYTLPPLIAPFISFVFILMASMKYIEVIEKTCFVRAAPVGQLVEGDWLIDEIEGIKKRGIGLTKEDIEKIKSRGLKKVMIKDGIPFIPAFLFAFLGNLFLGNLVLGLFFPYQNLAGLSLIS